MEDLNLIWNQHLREQEIDEYEQGESCLVEKLKSESLENNCTITIFSIWNKSKQTFSISIDCDLEDYYYNQDTIYFTDFEEAMNYFDDFEIDKNKIEWFDKNELPF